MPNETLVRVARDGGDAWNSWRASRGVSEPDLCDADLEEVDLRGADLTGVRFNRANLFGAKLGGADLTEAQFWNADLRCTDLEAACLDRVTLREADLRASLLVNAPLRRADCREATFKGAELFGCRLDGADLKDADFTEAVISGCHFTGAMMDGTNFAGARLWYSVGLDEVEHHGPSYLDPAAATTVPGESRAFLEGIGWPERLIQNWRAISSEGIAFFSCFISYSHSDMAFAHRLHDALQREGIRCWLDEHSLLPGDDIRDQIDSGIRLWDKIVLCCSEASLTSWWVDQEIERALQKEQRLWRERGEKVLALVPVRLDDFVFDGWMSGKKATVTSRYIADLTTWEGGSENDDDRGTAEFEKLVRALSADPLARGLPPAPKL